MPHRLASLHHIPQFDNSLTRTRLRLVHPMPAGAPSEYLFRIVDDHELPAGKSWMIVLIPGEGTLVAWSRSVMARADETTQEMVEACWTAYRTLLENP